MIISPSTTSPFPSTQSTRSASPSKAMPMSSFFSLTQAIRFSRWVEPQAALMLVPSGLSESITQLTPSEVNSFSAVREEEPFAQSNATVSPSRRSVVVEATNLMYSSMASGL